MINLYADIGRSSVYACSRLTTAIMGSKPAEVWMFVCYVCCVLCR